MKILYQMKSRVVKQTLKISLIIQISWKHSNVNYLKVFKSKK